MKEEEMNLSIQQSIFDYLKDNLRVTITNNADRGYPNYGGSSYVDITTTVQVFLTNPETKEEVLISEDRTSDSFRVED